MNRTHEQHTEAPHGSHGHDHVTETGDLHGQAFWDDRYASREQIWSGEPNRQLVTEAASLSPGHALDVGSGEGADALWLAERGWRVTAADVSPVALARASARAAEHGDEVASRIVWEHVDVRSWAPPPLTYDLVSAQFLHPAPDVRPQVVLGLAAAVAPGGVLLYVGHDASDRDVHGHPEVLATAPEIARLLDGDVWDVETAEARPRPGPRVDGRTVTLHDAVVRARRRR